MPGRRLLAAGASLVLVLSGLGAVALLQAPAARADVLDNGYSQTFFVNDARDVVDANPGDGVCATRFMAGNPAASTCTLYAAIQEANARPAGESILIAPAPQIRQVDGSFAASAEIELNWNTTNNPAPQAPNMSLNMVADAGIVGVIDGDTNSRYWIRHNNVTLDFQNRLGWSIEADIGPNVLLFTGTNQTFRNFTKLTSAESGIYVGATAENFSLVNGAVANPATTPALPSNYAIERGVVIVEGAKNTTIQNVHFQRSYWDAVLLAPATNAANVIDGLTIDRSSWDQPVNGGGYDPVYNFFVRNWSATVSGNNVTITNNTVRAWGADGGASNVIQFSGGVWNNLMIRGNTFTGTVNQAVNPIQLNALGSTTTTVRDNTFIATVNRTSLVDYSWVRTIGTTAGAQIFNNTFVGGANAVQLANQSTAALTNPFYRNTMTRVSGTATAANENTLTASNNIYNAANGTIRTTFPTVAAVIDTPPQSCRIDVTVAPPSTTGGAAIPTQAIYVDVYLGRTVGTGGDGVGLEQYLGRISTTQSALPSVFSLPYTGAGAGNVVRLQTTEVSTGRTSQYSRQIAASGADSCAPQSWIKQGGWFSEVGEVSSTQEDPTSFRQVSFDIRTSEPLGANGVDASDIVFSGTAPDQQVVSLTRVSDTTWSLVAKANGTGTIVPSIPAGAISDVTGNVSVSGSNATTAPIDFAGYVDASQVQGVPGSSIDSSVTYNSPLEITEPVPLELAVAEPGSESATFRVANLSVDENGRVTKAPSATVFLTQVWSDLVADAAVPELSPPQAADSIARALPTHPALSSTQPTLDTIDRYVDVPVQAIDNLVVDGNRGVTLSLQVTCDDLEFDGLLLSPVDVAVTDNDQPVGSSSTLSVTQDGQVANGSALNALTAVVTNGDGASVSNASVTFTVPTGATWTGPDGDAGTSDDVVGGDGVTATILTGASGAAVLHLTSLTPGQYSVAATVNGGDAIGGSPQSVTFVRSAIDVESPDSNYTVSTGDALADGSASHTVTVHLIDGDGNPGSGWADSLVAVATPAAGVTIGAFSPTGTPGEYAANVTSTVSGVKGIAVSLTDDSDTVHSLSLLAGGNPNAEFVAGAPVVGDGFSTLTIDASGDRVANGSAFREITVVLADSNSNPVTGAAALLSSSVADNANGAVTVSGFAETAQPGTYSALVRSTEAGSHQVTVAFDDDLTVGTVAAVFIPGATDLGNEGTRFAVSSGDQAAGTGQHTVTVTLADAHGNPVPGQAASLSATSATSLGDGSITGFVETSTPGIYTAGITSTIAGGKAITARLGVSALTLSGNGTATFVAGDADLSHSLSHFTVSGGDVTVVEGEHGVTVTLADEFGNPVSGRAADLVATTVADLGGGGVGAFTETAQPGTYLALVTSTVAGEKPLTVTLAGDAVTLSGNGVASFVASSVDVNNIGTRYYVSDGSETVNAGTHTITVTLSDSLGNPVSDQADGILSSTLADLGGGAISAFVETAVPGTYTATVTSTVTGDKAITTVFGAEKLTVLLDGNDTATFVPAEVALGSSGFEVSTGTATAGVDSHTATIVLRDEFGNPVPGRAADLVAATSTPQGALISAVSETVTPGTYTASITSTTAGAKVINVMLEGVFVSPTGNDTALFAAGGVDLGSPATFYVVSGGSVSVSGGSHTVTIYLADQFSNPVTAQAAELLATTADSLGAGGIGYFVETTAGVYEASITSSVSGAKAVAATYAGDALTLVGNGLASFVAGGVAPGNENTRYSVSSGTQTVGIGEHTVTVTLADADGNPVSGQAVGLSAESASSLGAGAISAFTETGTAGTYTATVTSTLAGDRLILVDFGGGALLLEGNGTASFAAAGVDITNPATGYVVSGGQVSVVGGAHAVTVTLADEFGNPVSGQGTPLVAGASASLGTGMISGFTEGGIAGTYTAVITSTNAGSKAITATFAGDALTLLGNGNAVFVAGGVDTGNAATRFAVSQGSQPVGTGTHTITVTLADADGNPASDQALGLGATTTGDLGTGGISSFTETGTAGTYLATVTSSVAGGATISVTFGGSGLSTVANNVANFEAGPVDLLSPFTGLSVTAGEASVAGGAHTISVTLADTLGNPISGLAADLAAATGDQLGTGSITGFVEASAGLYTAAITSSVSGGKTITATLLGAALAARGNDVATFVSSDVDLGNPGTHYAVSTGDVVVGTGQHVVTATLVDATGNPVTGRESLLSATTGDGIGAGVISSFTESDTTPGTYTATVTSTLAGGKTLAAAVNGEAMALEGNGVAAFVAGVVDLDNAATGYLVSEGNEIVVSGEHAVTITVADEFGNAVSGQATSLLAATTDDLGTGVVSAVTESAIPGTYTATVTSSVAGSKVVSATFLGAELTASGNNTAVFVAGPAEPGNAGTGFFVSSGDAPVGTGSHTITVTLADAQGNPVSGSSGALVGATADPLGAGTVSSFTESGTPGTYTATVTATIAGGKTMTVTVNGQGLTASGNDTATFSPGTVDLANANTAYLVSTGNQTVGTGEHSITVTLADEFGNAVAGQATELTASTSADLGTGAVSAFTESGTPGTYTAAVSSTVAGGKAMAVTLSGDDVTLVGNGTALFVAGNPDLGNEGSNVTVSTGEVSVSGGSHSITVQLADSLGNPVPGQAGLLVATTMDPLGTGSISALLETATAGTYVATVTSSIAGDKAITATFAGDGITADGNTSATFVAGGVDPDNPGTHYTVSTGNETVGTGEHIVTVALADSAGNPVSGQELGITAETLDDLGTGAISAFAEVAGTPGRYTATVTSTIAGDKAVTVLFGGSPVLLDGNDTAAFVAAAVDPGNPGTTYSVSTGETVVGTGAHAVTVALADEFGNAVPGQSASLSGTTTGDLGAGAITGFVETATAGTYAATITSTLAGPKPITVTAGLSPVALSGNGTALFVAGPVDLEHPGTGFAVSTGEVSVAGGEHSVTVNLADEFGNPLSNQAANLTGTTTDDLGTGAVSSFSETGTTGTYLATVTSTVAGGKTIAVTLGADSVSANGNAIASFAAGGVDPTHPDTIYVVTTGDETVGTGEHIVTVTLADAAGNPVSGQAVGLSAATVDDLGAGEISAFVETGTPGTYTATITSTLAGGKLVTVATGGQAVSAAGNTTAAFVAGTVDLGNAHTTYSVSTGDVSVEGGSHLVTIFLADEFGNPVSGEQAALVAETADELGTGSITAVAETGTPGEYSATITSSVSGAKALTATFNGTPISLDGNGTASFVSGGVDTGNAGTRYSVSTGNETVSTGSHTVTVTLADAAGNPVPGQALGISATTADDLGLGAVSGFIESGITAGTYTATVTSTVSGNKVITVVYGASPVTLEGNGTAVFVPGAIDFGNAATTYSVSTGDQVVSTGQHTVTVTLADALGNPVAGQQGGLVAATVDDLGSGAILPFAETGTAGTYAATVRSTLAGGKTITVALGVNSLNASGNSVAQFIAGQVDLGHPGTTYTVSPGDVSVDGGAHEVTVTLADEFGNPVSGQATDLAATTVDSLGTGAIGPFSESASITGTYTATITSSVAGGKAVTATLGDEELTAAGNIIASFISGGVDTGNANTRYSVTTGTETVGTGQHTITVTLADAEGNSVPGQEAGLTATTADDLGSGTIASFTESETTPGTYYAFVTSTISGDKTIAVEFGANSLTASGNTVAAFVAGSADLSNPGSGFVVSTGEQTVGTGEHTVTVTLADSLGNPVPGRAADLTASTLADLGAGAILAFAESSTTPGTYTAAVTSTVTGSKAITVTLEAAAVTPAGNGTAVFAAADVDLTNPGTHYSVSSGDASVSGGLHTVTVTLLDAYGNGVAGAASDLTGTAPNLGTGAVSAFGATATAGVYTATVTSSVAGDKEVEATFAGNPVSALGNTTARFVAGEVDLANPGTSYSVSTGDAVVAVGSHTVTVTLADELGNPVPGRAAGLLAETGTDLGDGMVAGFVESSTTPGTYSATVTSTVSGVKPLAVTLSGDAVTLQGNGEASFVAGQVDLSHTGSSFTVSSGDVSVVGGSHTVTINLADSFGNPVPGLEADLVANSGDDLGTGSLTAVIESTTTPGTYTATVTSSVAGGKTITVALGASQVNADGNAIASFIAGGVDPGNVATGYTVSEGDQVVGTGSHTVTVTLADAEGNPAAGQALGLVADSGDALGGGGISAFTESDTVPGTYWATVTSTVAGGKSITVLFGATPLTLRDNGVAAFVAAAVDLDNSATTYAVSTGNQLVGSGSHTVTISLADAWNNPVTGQAVGINATTSGSLGTGALGAITESGVPGTYVATVTSSVAGSKPITVTWEGTEMNAVGNTTATFIADAVDPGNPATSYSVSGGEVSVSGGAHVITAVLVDALGNPAPDHAAAIVAATADNLGSGSISAFTETSTPGTYTASITSSIVGSKGVTVAVATIPIALNGNGTATFTAGGVDPAHPDTSFAVSTGDRTVGATPHVVTVHLADTEGNPVPGQAACLTASTVNPLGGGGIDPFTATNVPGVYEADIRSTVAGSKTITVTCGANALTVDGNDQASFVADVVDPSNANTAFSVSSGEQVVGSGSHTVTVTLADENGNPVSGQAAQLVADADTSLGAGLITGFAESGATPGAYTATITSTIAGSKTIAVTLSGAALQASGNTGALFVAAGVDLADAGSRYSVTTGDVSIDGGSHLVTITLTDAFGNPVPGQASLLLATTIADLGTGAVAAVIESGTPGTYTATVTSSMAGDKPVTVTYDGNAVSLNGNDTAAFVVGGVDLGNAATRYTVSPGSEQVGTGSHMVTVMLADGGGNPVTGQGAGLTASSATSLGMGGITAFTETGTPGTYEATITSTIAGEKPITVRFGASTIALTGNGTALFAPGSYDLGNSASHFTVSTGPATVGTGFHTITVAIADQFGNAVPGLSGFSAATTADLGAGAILAFAETTTPGTYTARIQSTMAGAKPVTVTLESAEVTRAGNGVALFSAGAPDPGAAIITATSPVQANGRDFSVVTVRLFDQYGNPAAQLVPVTVTATLGSVTASSTAGGGVYSAQVRSNTGGTATVTAVVNGTPIADSAEVIFIDSTPPSPPVVDPTDGTEVTGCADPGSTVTVYDTEGNPLGSATAGEDCRFLVTLSPAQKEGAAVTVTVTDPHGNVSTPVTVRVGLIWMELESANVQTGTVQRAYGHNFQPGEAVSGVLESEPLDLGTQVADANGDVTFAVRIPTNFAHGKHTITHTGGFSGSVAQSFTVYGPEPTLSVTGFGSGPLWGIGALVLLAGGFGLLLIGRRRDSTAD